MAYNRRYESTYFSLNGRQYYLEIRDQNWPSGVGVKEADLGVGGCSIQYDMEGEEKYSPIIASKMDIPFMVKDATDKIFIKNLIEDYNEGDVVVALYLGNGANYRPVWAGYLLMDLGAQQDVDYPYEVKITATDGLARLKDIGFWSDEVNSITYKHKGHERITYWIGEILNKVTPPGTTQGISQNANIRAAVNWYNQRHQSAATSFGPLYQTQIKMGMFEQQDGAGNSTVSNCYEVLKTLCIALGMRVVYWKHSFYFIQLDGYNTAESGTLANPTNINTRDYSLADPPVHTASRDYLGTAWWTRYNQNIENVTTPGKGIQKLSGTTYQNYPILKRVTADYISAETQNFYRGFPESSSADGTTVVQVVQEQMDDPSAGQNLFLTVPLIFQQDTSVASFSNNFLSYKVEFKCRVTATIPSGATGTPAATTYNLKYNGSGNYAWTTAAYNANNNDFVVFETNTLTAANTGVQTLTPKGTNGTLPKLTGVTGSWQITIKLASYFSNGSPKDPVLVWKDPQTGFPLSVANGSSYTTHGVKWVNALNPNVSTTSNTVISSPGLGLVSTQSWTTTNGNPFLGQLFLLNTSSSVGPLGQRIVSSTNETDTSQLNLGQMRWGDAPMDSDSSSIQVWNGSSWVFTAAVGEWGVNTTSGNSSLTKLLLKQYLDGQSFHVYKMNARITLSTHNKYSVDSSGTRPKYINPVGRINDVDGKSYVFLRGTFTTGNDTWDGEWFNIGVGTPTITTTSTDIYGKNTPEPTALPMNVIGGGSGNISQKLANPLAITTTSSYLAATDILTNGQFTTDSDWTKGTNVTIADSKLKFASVTTGAGALSTASTVTLGKQYNVRFAVSEYTSGGVYVKLGATSGITVMADGDYNQNIIPETSTTIQLLANKSNLTNTKSLDFDGSDDYVDISGVDTTINTTTGSVSAWVKLDTIGVSCTIFMASVDANNFIRLWYKNDDSDLKWQIKRGGTNNVIDYSTSIEGDGNWHHIAMTWDNNDLKGYLDGTEVATGTMSGTWAGTIDTVHIGRYTVSSTSYWLGNIDEVALWDSALSATAISSIRNLGNPTDLLSNVGSYSSTSSLIGWWRMGDDATYPTIPDASTNSNSGTMTNMASGDIVTDVSSVEPSTTLNIGGIIITERITSVPIEDIGETLLSINDRVSLVDSNSGNVHLLTLNANQTSGDTSLSVDAFSIENEIAPGALISIDFKNLIQQYQNRDIVYFGTADTLTKGTLYTFKSDNTWTPADASAVGTSTGLLGIALGTGVTDGILLKGMVTLNHDPGTIGDVLYLSPTAGQITSTIPTTAGEIVRIMGYCLNSSSGLIWYNPDSIWVELS